MKAARAISFDWMNEKQDAVLMIVCTGGEEVIKFSSSIPFDHIGTVRGFVIGQVVCLGWLRDKVDDSLADL